MSRSGYSDDCEYLELYRATVKRSIKGKRGQAFLSELAAALDAMPEKALIRNELINEHGEVCAIGAVCKARSMDVSRIHEDEPEDVARAVGIAQSMAAEIAFENDESRGLNELPHERWQRMRKWVADNLSVQP